jgi:mono/diheme cytochrome c family protein
MRKLFKIVGVIVGGLIGLIVVAAGVIFFVSNTKVNQTYSVKPQPLSIAIPTDAESINEGKRLTQIRGCADCHAADYGGNPTFVSGDLGTISSANITKSGRVANYSDEDWLRAIRHGVDPTGRGLWIMPSHEFFPLSDGDIAKTIAFMKTVPPVTRDANERNPSFLARALVATNQIPLAVIIPASGIQHSQKPPEAPAVGVTTDYGKYMSYVCSGCHNANYSGGPAPDTSPGDPIPANLTQIVKAYDEVQFMSLLRTGVALGNRQIPSNVMPPLGANMTDTELKALYAYFKSLPAKETGK